MIRFTRPFCDIYDSRFGPALLALAAAAWLSVAHAQPAAPAPVAPNYSGTSGVIPWSAIMEKPLSNTGNSGSASAASTGAADAVKGDGKPIHEELSRSNLQESIREFNAGEAGVKKPNDEAPAGGARPPGNPLSPAAKAAQAKINRAEWASVNENDRFFDDIFPWIVFTSILLVLVLAVKLWLNYLKAKAARPGMRRRAARKRSERGSRSSGSSIKRPSTQDDGPDSQGHARTQSRNSSAALVPNTSGGRNSQPSGTISRATSGTSSGRSSSTSSGSESSSSRQRQHRSPRSQL